MDALPIVTPMVSTSPDFDAVFVASYGRLVRTMTVVCGDVDVAADCVADAFERAYVRWRRVSRLEDPVGWIRRVAINRSRDAHRRATRGHRAVERLAALQGDGTIPAPEIGDGDLLGHVAALPPQQRTVVALHYLEDLPVADVASVMGLSAGTVKFHLHRARERLRSALDTTPGGSS